MDLKTGAMLLSYEEQLKEEADNYHRRQELMYGIKQPTNHSPSVFDNPAAAKSMNDMDKGQLDEFKRYGEHLYSHDHEKMHLNCLIEHVKRIRASLKAGLDRDCLHPEEIRALKFLYGDTMWKNIVFGDPISKSEARRINLRKRNKKVIDTADPEVVHEIDDILDGLGVKKPDNSNIVIENDWREELSTKKKSKSKRK